MEINLKNICLRVKIKRYLIMKKISTLFLKDPKDLGRVINEINPENKWVYDEPGIPTRKFDGTAAAIINGILYKRYDVKKGKQVPLGAIQCQEADPITGHWPHWIKCEKNKPEDKYFWEAYNSIPIPLRTEGTYELCGPKINGNPEKLNSHQLIRHGIIHLDIKDFSFNSIKSFLSDPMNDIEGIVFHGQDGKMCKIRKSDFAIKR